MVRKIKSTFGEGIGSKVEIADDANNPSFDTATHKSAIDELITKLLSDDILPLLEKWELQFLTNMYGRVPLSYKQRKTIFRMNYKYLKDVKDE